MNRWKKLISQTDIQFKKVEKMSQIRIDANNITINVLGKALAILLSVRPKSFKLKKKFRNIEKVWIENLELINFRSEMPSLMQMFEDPEGRNDAERYVLFSVQLVTIAYSTEETAAHINGKINALNDEIEGITFISTEEVYNVSSRYPKYLEKATDASGYIGGIFNDEYKRMRRKMAVSELFGEISNRLAEVESKIDNGFKKNKRQLSSLEYIATKIAREMNIDLADNPYSSKKR